MNPKDPFKLEQEGPVAWLTLNRPEKRNAMDKSFFRGLADYFSQLDEDPDVRVVVIKAEGKSFTAGLDLTEAGTEFVGTGADVREALRKRTLQDQESMSRIEQCRKPVFKGK